MAHPRRAMRTPTDVVRLTRRRRALRRGYRVTRQLGSARRVARPACKASSEGWVSTQACTWARVGWEGRDEGGLRVGSVGTTSIPLGIGRGGAIMKDRRVVMRVGDGGVVAGDVRRAGRPQPGAGMAKATRLVAGLSAVAWPGMSPTAFRRRAAAADARAGATEAICPGRRSRRCRNSPESTPSCNVSIPSRKNRQCLGAKYHW